MAIGAKAQRMSQTVSVVPPYSNKLSDYIASPGKINNIITVEASEYSTAEIYLRGMIIKTDESVEIRTAQNHKPSQPILIKGTQLPTRATVFQPYNLTYGDILQIFDPQHLEYRGVTREDVMQKGIPEGSYQVCFTIYDFKSNEFITDACSNTFNILAAEAPTIIQPLNQTKFDGFQAKNIIFSWTRPHGAPLATQYKLRIIELNDPNVNYRDMIKNDAYPTFFETVVTGNTYLYSYANPQLTEGKTYAFVVSAIDPFNKTAFKNKGFSEVNVFTYQPQEQETMSGSLPGGFPDKPVVKNFQVKKITPLCPKISTIKGVLKYKYKQGNEKKPLSRAKIKLVQKYIVRYADGSFNEAMTHKKENDFLYRDNVTDGKEVAVTTTGDNGEFSFSFFSNYDGEPLGDTECESGIAYYNPSKMSSDNTLLLCDNSINSKHLRGPAPQELEMQAAPFDNEDCKLYLGYRIVIEGEHANYYLDPDQTPDYYFEVKGGETKDVGEVTSLVRTIDLDILVKSRTSSLTINSEETLSNMDVFLFRKINFDYPFIFPTDDVFPNKEDNFPAPVGGMELVGQALTNSDGIASFYSLVFSDNPTYQYYLYINNSQNYNYQTDAPVFIDFEQLLDASKGVAGQDDSGNPFVYGASLPSYSQAINIHSAYKWFDGTKEYKHTEELEVKFPSLQIILQEKEGNKKLKQIAFVTLTEDYTAGNYRYANGKLEKLENYLQRLTSMPLTADDGTYELNNLPLELKNINSAVGPRRTVTVKTEGFADTTFLVKEGNPLKMGERFKMLITLRYGAHVSGKVIDAETREPLSYASVKILGEMEKVATTGNNGVYSFDARKTDKKKLVEISRVGYMTDTVEIAFDKDNNIHNFELYQKLRRLRVEVWSGNAPKKGMHVSLPDVPISWSNTDSNIQIGNLSTPKNGNKPMSYSGKKLKITKGKLAAKMLNNKTFQKKKPALQVSANTSSLVGQLQRQSYSEVTSDDGIVDFSFRGGQNDRFKVIISNDANSDENIPTVIKEVDIPYSKDYMGSLLQVTVDEGTCLSGTVYLGETNNKPLEGINVKATITGQLEEYTIETKTDANGNYKLRNLPVNKSFKLQVSTNKAGSNFVGYSNNDYILSKPDSKLCKKQDFHMKAIDGVDVTLFLGFPFAASDFEELSNKNILLSGTITLPANKHFKEQEIDVENVEMKKSGIKNSEGNELLEPTQLPFVTDKNNIIVSMSGNYTAMITDDSGLKLDLYDKVQMKGSMNAQVKINEVNNSSLNGNFGGYGYSLPDLYLAQEPNTKKTEIIVFKSSDEISSPNIGENGFYLSDGKNTAMTYSIDGFENKAVVVSDKSYFDKNGLSLKTKLKASIANLNPTNLELDAGVIRISKQGLATINQQPFDVQMGKWTLKCNNWSVTNEGVKVSDATLSTGIDVKIENLEFTSNALNTDKATVHLDKVKLLGVKTLNINTTQKGLVYKYLHDGVSGWSLYATPDAGQTTVATLENLPGLAAGEKIEFLTVDLNSEGENILALNSHKFRLYNIVDFTPYPSTMMYVTPSSLKLQGTYDFGIPEYVQPSGSMGFFKEGNHLAFDMMDMDAFRFTHHNVKYDLTHDYILSEGLFTAKGTVEEPGNLPKLNVTMRHTGSETKVEINEGETLPMGADKELVNLKGGIKVVNNAWEVFRFEGITKGMGNMQSEEPMSFEVRGAVTATEQKITVDDIPSFPGLSLTYDLPNSRLIGHAAIDMNLGGMLLKGDINTIMDSNGWIFQAGGMLTIPGFGDAGLYGLFGNYSNISPEVKSQIGNPVCLPAAFNTNIRGFFLSASLTRQVLPRVHYNYGIVSVEAGVDLTVNARTFMLFGQGLTFGLGVLAEGHAYLNGSCDATCTEANADAKLQLGISGDYNTQTHNYNIDGCSSLSLKIDATQCVPVLIGCGPCASIDLVDFTIGASVHLDNINGFSMGIKTTSCDQQCTE